MNVISKLFLKVIDCTVLSFIIIFEITEFAKVLIISLSIVLIKGFILISPFINVFDSSKVVTSNIKLIWEVDEAGAVVSSIFLFNYFILSKILVFFKT